jgi:hypothetical protein
LSAFLSYVKDEHKMEEPKLYTIITDILQQPCDRERVEDDYVFREALHKNEFYVFEGGKGRGSPKKGRDGLPLMVITSIPYRGRGAPGSARSPPGSGSSPGSTKRTLQRAMRAVVKDRDRRCVITGTEEKLGSECENCHIIAVDEDVRRLDVLFVKMLEISLKPTDWAWIQPLLEEQTEYVHLISPFCTRAARFHSLLLGCACARIDSPDNLEKYFKLKVDIADRNPYDPRLGLFCLKFFNNPIQYGEVYFETTTDPTKVRIHFETNFKVRMPPELQSFDGAFLLYPGSDADRQSMGFDESTLETRRRQWPPKIIFDLHRLVLAQWGRANQARKRDEEEEQQRKREGEAETQSKKREKKRKAADIEAGNVDPSRISEWR